MKLAPVVRALATHGANAIRIVHTGQHYDAAMNDVFFEELGIPAPDVHLDVGSGTHGAQTARIIERYETHLLARRPAATVVFGDVNSTVACALAAVKLGIPVAHVEAGLRSFDRSMPEEINRILTDAIADLLLVTEPSGVANLAREGVPDSKIRLVGNVMIDTLLCQIDEARARHTAGRLGVGAPYGFVTLHRPSNVDDPEKLGILVRLLHQLARRMPLVFAIHPRTAAAARNQGLGELLAEGQQHLVCVGPQPYLDSLSLVAGAAVVLTDSGGLQEECSVLGVPCLTLRENTERPVTVTLGTSRLVGNDPAKIVDAFNDVLDGRWARPQPIPLWDGKAGMRIATELATWVAGDRLINV
jgi:UDP-N-acetylglucosamine 2-epimerase (non-hydrolysing)